MEPVAGGLWGFHNTTKCEVKEGAELVHVETGTYMYSKATFPRAKQHVDLLDLMLTRRVTGTVKLRVSIWQAISSYRTHRSSKDRKHAPLHADNELNIIKS